MLQIKAKSAMLGYLNAPSPFTNDDWFKTGDAVEVDGEYIKILGRKSEIINVGGEKVYPQEVENVILEMDNVAEAMVYSENNPIIGNIVCAEVRLLENVQDKEIIRRLKNHCSKNLQRYKIPVKIVISNKEQYTGRFKKYRSSK
jgi:acyl-CoA synthetase (AMP-forming)/AMP-acid ligase II